MNKLLLLCFFSVFVWANYASASSVKIQPVKVGESTFPLIVSSDHHVADRINLVLIQRVFLLEPHEFSQSLNHKAIFNILKKPTINQFDLDYRVTRHDQVFTISISGEGCGAYCEMFSYNFSFDAKTGRKLTIEDILTPNGQNKVLQIIKTNKQNEIANQLKLLKSGGASFEKEQLDEAISLYEECQINDYSSLDDFSIGNDALLFANGRCSNHAMRALDDLDSFHDQFSFSTVKPDLTSYGKYLLLGEKTNQIPQSILGRVFKGKIGNAGITLYIEEYMSDENKVGGYYFYDRYRTPIQLKGVWKNNQLELEELNDQQDVSALLHFTISQNDISGYWESADGQKKLKSVLNP